MSQFSRSNPMAVRHCILYECMDGFPIFQSYKRLCRKMGDDVIDYVEFEFWFMRFSRGELDMNYDRSLEPKTRTFLDLPVDVIKTIGSHMDFLDILPIRNVCKFFQTIVDSWIPGYKYFSMVIEDNSTILWFDQYHITYNRYNVELGRERKPLKSEKHWKWALNDLLPVIRNPKAQLEKLYVKFNTQSFIEEQIAARFIIMDERLKAQNVEIVTGYSSGEMSILPFLEPGTLKQIVIDMNDISIRLRLTENNFKTRLNLIGELEQCQLSDMLIMKFYYYKAAWFPIESFVNCTNIDLSFSGLGDDAIRITDVQRFKKAIIKSVRLNYFHLVSNCNFTINGLKNKLGKSALEVPGRPEVRHFKIPNSDQYFEFDLSLSQNHRLDLRIQRVI